MDHDTPQLHVGDSIVVVGTPDDGELGTVIEILPDPAGRRYRIVFETGREVRLEGRNLARRV